MERILSEEDQLIIAALFALPSAVDAAFIAKLLGIEREEAQAKLENLSGRLLALDGALLIKHVGDGYELCTNERFYEALRIVAAGVSPPVLTDTMMETLAIIVEKGSATRVDIEEIRGVKSDFAVSRLLEYGLIEETGRKNLPGRPMVFSPTNECLRRFGLGNREEIGELFKDSENGESS